MEKTPQAQDVTLPPEVHALRQAAPRPLGLYMMLLKGAEAAALALAPDDKARLATSTEATQDIARFLEGVQRYRSYPFSRAATPYTLLAHYGRCALHHCGGSGKPVFLVPSMVNKAYVLDLLPEASLVRSLIAAGHSVYMLDWNTPDGRDVLSFDTAVTDILVPAVGAACAHAKHADCVVLGYCMGGLLALALATHAPKRVRALVAAATPWDFSGSVFGALVKMGYPFYDLMLQAAPLVPVDMLQSAFMLLDPLGPVGRLQAFAAERDAGQLRRMAAMEDWLADGIPLESPIARTCLFDWYKDNKPLHGTWQVAGKTVDATAIDVPVLVAVPQRDIVVPAQSARALAGVLPQATVLDVPTGHIGMMVGRKAQTGFFDPLSNWLARLP
ncbi:MAG: alpha/beta fold hydrolase [Proteobacteria bacterium]|nr:alpha/beta fold hydrolase [Pseudomonadota bacterium]